MLRSRFPRSERPLAPAHVRRGAGRKAVALSLFAVVAIGAIAAGVSPADAEPIPENLRVIPRTESIVLRWTVSTEDGLAGWRVRYRPVSVDPEPWSAPIERPASARRQLIGNLSAQPYEVLVRAILDDGSLGRALRGAGTPLAGEEPVEEPEEPESEPSEEETPGVHAVNGQPTGPPAPLSGWHIAYADAFGTGDNTWSWREKPLGCCGNSNEINVEQPSRAVVGPKGLELRCVGPGKYTVGGSTKEWSCGGGETDPTFEWAWTRAGEWAVECVCRWPVNTGAADPGFWSYINGGAGGEIDFFEGWGWNGTSWDDSNAGIPVVVGVARKTLNWNATAVLGFDPSAAFHRYTTVYTAGQFDEYIDGVLRWIVLGTPDDGYDGLILTNALRAPEQGGNPSANVLGVRSVAVWQDGAHAGVGIRGGGIAPGTIIR
jgi:hypothetical protein